MPLAPLSDTNILLRERLAVVLLATVRFSELFVRSLNNAMPPVPLSWAGARLYAKAVVVNNMNINSITRLISFPR